MQPQIRHYQDDADMKTTTLRRCPNNLILIEGQCVQLWNWRKGGWRKANKLNHIRPLGNPAHISGLSCSLSFCLLYTFFIFSLCKLQSSIYYFWIFNRVLFLYFVCVLCTRSRSHWCASLLHLNFSTHHGVCDLKTLTTCSFITSFLKSLHPYPIFFSLSVSSELC